MHKEQQRFCASVESVCMTVARITVCRALA